MSEYLQRKESNAYAPNKSRQESSGQDINAINQLLQQNIQEGIMQFSTTEYLINSTSLDGSDSYGSIDTSRLTNNEKAKFDQNINKLMANKVFAIYFSRLMHSDQTYYIVYGSGEGGSGSYNPKTHEIHAVDNAEVLSQEIFHAYQSDLGVYDANDLSVRETEADLVSANIGLSTLGFSRSNTWDQGIGFDFIDDDMILNETILTEKFDLTFEEAVLARIEFYKEREKYTGAKAPYSYVQDNSGKGALALKKVIKELQANELNLQGPRLPNGDFYSE